MKWIKKQKKIKRCYEINLENELKKKDAMKLI